MTSTATSTATSPAPHRAGRVLATVLAVLVAATWPAAALAQTPATAAGEETVAVSPDPRVALETSKGTIVLELDPFAAPATVENFLAYVRAGFYDGTIFHRVISGFMIQGGGFTREMVKKETGEPVVNESKEGLSNLRGTVAMARTDDPHSATAQFFVNTVDNRNLDAGGFGPWGYTVFGRVVEGIETVDAIASVPTATRRAAGGPPMQNVPVEPIVIERAVVVEGDAAAGGTP